MKGIKKTLCLLLSLVMILSMGVPAFAFDNATSEAQANTTSSETSPFSIELSTDKSSYSATGIAKITAKVTNTSGKDIKNVSAEAVFGELAPCKKKSSQTTAEAETLKDGESLEFTYSATINKNAKKLNIFEKIILFFVRLFNGGYSAKDNGFDNGREFVESSNDIKFGKRWAKNTVKVWFGESGDDDKIIKLSTEVKELSTDEKDNKIVFTAEISNITGNVFLKCNESDLSIKFVKTDSANMLTCTAVLDNSSEKTYHFYAKSDSTLSNEVTVSIYQPFTENELDRIDAVDANIDELVNSNIYKSLAISEKALKMKELLMSLCEKGLIKNNSIKYDDELKCYEFEYADGGTAYIYIDKKLDINTSGFSTNTEIHPNNELIKSSLISEANYEATNSTYNRQGILIYDLWSAEENKNVYDYNEEVSSAWNTAGLPTTFQIDPTVDFYKTGLIGKSIIFIQEHGIELKRNELYGLSLRESVTRKATKSYSSDIKTKNKRVFKTKLADGSWSYIITPNFFSFYYENQLNDTLILLGSCMGFGKGQVYDYHFSMAFAEICKAICVVGFHNSVYTDYSTKIIGNLVLRVMDGYSVTEALNSVKSSYGDTDVQYKRKRVENLDKIVDGKNITWRTELENHEEAVPLIGGNGSIKMFNVGTVEGLVSEDETNIPLENVTIVATQNETVKTTQTNNNGKFTFILPAGTWEISVEDTDTHWCHEKQTITVEKGEEITITPPFYMKKGTKIQGCVRDSETQLPIANAKVELRDGTNFNVMHDVNGKYHASDFEDYKVLSTTTTDENGKYTFNMPSGKYVVAVYHDDYEFNGLYFSFEKNLDGYFPTDILLVPNGDGDDGDDDRPVTASGNCGAEGDNVKWILYDDGELVISGSGAMVEDMHKSNRKPWDSITNQITKVTIEDGVTSISNGAFSMCKNVQSLSLGNTIEVIGDFAFEQCGKMSSIVIPDSVFKIGNYAFTQYSHTIKKWILGKNLKEIGFAAIDLFYDDVDIYFNGSLTDWLNINKTDVSGTGHGWLSTAGGYYELYIDNLLVTNITIPNEITEINDFAFSGCNSITTMKTSENVEIIGESAFENCPNLTTVQLSNGIREIHSCAFSNTAITEITIPNTIEKMNSNGGSQGYSCFGFANKLKKVVFEEGLKKIPDGALYCYNNSICEIIIPNTVEIIGDYAFCDCSNLPNIIIPNRVTRIGECAFNGCKSLRSIKLPDNKTILEDGAFSSCTNLENIIIPNGVTSIGSDTFSLCTSLTEISIPNSVTSIGDYAFQKCTLLKNVDLGDGVTSMGEFVFRNCKNLKNISIPASLKISAYLGTFKDSYIETAVIEDGATIIPAHLFNKASYLREVSIPDSVTHIGRGAFESCTSLIEINIPDSVTSIGYYAISNCSNLKKITINNPKCILIDDGFPSIHISNTTVYGYKGSTAQACAEGQDCTFIPLD